MVDPLKIILNRGSCSGSIFRPIDTRDGRSQDGKKTLTFCLHVKRTILFHLRYRRGTGNNNNVLGVLRSAVGKTHVLRQGLVMDYAASYFPCLYLTPKAPHIPMGAGVLRSAVGKTHVLRQGLVMDYATSYFPLIILGYPLDSKRSYGP